ncbi:hypothetical protein [Glycomyces tarimensis]
MSTKTVCDDCGKTIAPAAVSYTIECHGPITMATHTYARLHLCETCAGEVLGPIQAKTTPREG